MKLDINVILKVSNKLWKILTKTYKATAAAKEKNKINWNVEISNYYEKKKQLT